MIDISNCTIKLILNMTKLAYLTDNRSSFIQGNYYQCYINEFLNSEKFYCEICHIEKEYNFNNYDIIVVGHGATKKLCQFKCSYHIKNINKSTAKKILFTRNDYGRWIKPTQNILDKIKPDLTITHTKKAIKFYNKHKIIWLPFSLDYRFKNTNQKRIYDIGFIGNHNSNWNNNERNTFIKMVQTTSNRLDLKSYIKVCSNGEDFLLGQDYIDWMNKCKIIVGSVSANGTVGPKFLESMACGCGVIAPYNTYEDFLVEDKHYMSIRDVNDIEYKIQKFLNDESYRNAILNNCKLLVKDNSINNQIKQILSELNE